MFLSLEKNASLQQRLKLFSKNKIDRVPHVSVNNLSRAENSSVNWSKMRIEAEIKEVLAAKINNARKYYHDASFEVE